MREDDILHLINRGHNLSTDNRIAIYQIYPLSQKMEMKIISRGIDLLIDDDKDNIALELTTIHGRLNKIIDNIILLRNDIKDLEIKYKL